MATYSVTLKGSWGPASGSMGDSDCYVEINSVQYKSAQVIEVQSGTVIKVCSKSPSTGYVAKIYMNDSVVSQSTSDNLYAEYEFTVDSPCTIESKSSIIASVYTIYTIYIVKEAPPKNHKTLIGGTGYEIKGGRTLVGGTGYDISKGRTLVDGTGYDIAFNMPITDLSVGDSVFLRENGVLVEYLIVNKGIPSGSALYDSSCDGIWLLRKDIHSNQQFSSASKWGGYSSSLMHTYLNATFLNLFDSDTQAKIMTVKIPYVNASGAIRTGANGVSTKIFLLSCYEIGLTTSIKSYVPANEGARLSFFNAVETDSKRIAYLDGAADYWFLRSPNTNTGYVWTVNTSGGVTTFTPNTSKGIRPALVISSDAIISASHEIIG